MEDQKGQAVQKGERRFLQPLKKTVIPSLD
jgi:hypothetical protein